MTPLSVTALDLAGEGFPVLPLRPNGKAPMLPHGCKDASAISDVVNAWWRRWSGANVGVATGDGFFVVDIDVKNGVNGEVTWATIQHSNAEAPMTRTVMTPNGHHEYFGTSGANVPCSAGSLGAGVDVRGTGGYVVAAGVVEGKPYKTLARPIAPAPAWLLELVRLPERARRPVIDWRQRAAERVDIGRRNSSLASFAGYLLRKGVDPWAALELLRAWNQMRCSPPLPDAEVVACVDSIAGRELRRRRGGRS